MTRPGPWLLLLVCWFAAGAGSLWLQPELLLSWPDFSAAQVGVWACQMLSLGLLVRLSKDLSALAQWLGLLAWWAWPWQGLAQWLRVSPAESAWNLAVVLWIYCLRRKGAGPLGAWACLLVMAWLKPACLAGGSAALSLVLSGPQRWLAGALGCLAMLLDFQAATPDHLGWAALALGVGLGSRDGLGRLLALFTLVTAAKGGPTSSALLAWAVAAVCQRWAPTGKPWRMGLALAGTWWLGVEGETQLNRRLIVPWQKQGLSLSQGLVPHSLDWWARSIGPRFGVGPDQLSVCQWLRGQLGVALWLPDANPFLGALSGGRVLLRPDPWGLAALRSTGTLEGTGVDWLVLKGSGEAAFRAGSLKVRKNPQADLPRVSAESFQIRSEGGPGGDFRLQIRASAPVVAGQALPRLVLPPGELTLRAPFQAPALQDAGLALPALDGPKQMQEAELSCPERSLPAHSIVALRLELRNHSRQPLNLQALAGLRARWRGQEWQPICPCAETVMPGNALSLEVPLETHPLVGCRELELVWEDGQGEFYPAGRWVFSLWPQQQPEDYLNLGPS